MRVGGGVIRGEAALSTTVSEEHKQGRREGKVQRTERGIDRLLPGSRQVRGRGKSGQTAGGGEGVALVGEYRGTTERRREKQHGASAVSAVQVS